MTEVTRKRRKGQPPLGGPGAGIVELEASQHLKTAGLRVPVQSGRPGNLLELEQQSAGNGRAAAQPPPWPGAAEATEAAPQASTTTTEGPAVRVSARAARSR